MSSNEIKKVGPLKGERDAGLVELICHVCGETFKRAKDFAQEWNDNGDEAVCFECFMTRAADGRPFGKFIRGLRASVKTSNGVTMQSTEARWAIFLFDGMVWKLGLANGGEALMSREDFKKATGIAA